MEKRGRGGGPYLRREAALTSCCVSVARSAKVVGALPARGPVSALRRCCSNRRAVGGLGGGGLGGGGLGGGGGVGGARGGAGGIDGEIMLFAARSASANTTSTFEPVHTKAAPMAMLAPKKTSCPVLLMAAAAAAEAARSRLCAFFARAVGFVSAFRSDAHAVHLMCDSAFCAVCKSPRR